MDDVQSKLLAQGIIVLPEEIEHATYEYVLEALVERTGQPVYMYCKGDGGDSRSALAIADLISLHGAVVGLLVGEANSSHVTVWAACQTRYISPNGGIGVHKVAWSSFDGRADSHNMRLVADQFDATETKTARILEGASNKGWDWWLKLIQQAGSSGVRQFDAEAVIRMGMARPISEWDSPRGEIGILDTRGVTGAPQGERPMVTLEQIEVLKGLGYAVNQAASVMVNGRKHSGGWGVVREWTDLEGSQLALLGSALIAADGWVMALHHAQAKGLVDPATEDSPQGESDLDQRLKRGGAQFQYPSPKLTPLLDEEYDPE